MISVIMPAYNCAKFIEKAVESVLGQTYPHLELILIDDCSKDNTKEIIEKYKKDSRFHYIQNESNMGVSRSRNRAIASAKGEYLAFLDGDDWWEKDKLQKQIGLIEQTGCVICCTGRKLWSHEGEDLGKIIHAPTWITYKDLLKTNNIGCSSVLVKTEVMREFPMEHDEVNEDYLAWLRILKKYENACGIDEPLLDTRLSKKGKSRNKLKSLKMNYGVYRYLGFSRVVAVMMVVRNMAGGIQRYI